MTICRSYDRWGTGTTERAAAQPSPNLRQRPPHLSSIGKPTEQQNESETPAMRILRVFPFTATKRRVYPQTTVETPTQQPSTAPCTISAFQNDGKQQNESKMAEKHVLRSFHLTTRIRHVDPQTASPMAAQPSPNSQQRPPHHAHLGLPTRELSDDELAGLRAAREYRLSAPTRRDYPQTTVAAPTQHHSPAPRIVVTMQNDEKRQNESETVETPVYDTGFNDILLDLVERVKSLEKNLKGYCDSEMASRSVTVIPTPKLPTPPRVLSPPSLAWVPSPPSIAQTPLVLPTILAAPTVPPGLKKPTHLLPLTTETIPTPPKLKPDLGPVVHTIVYVIPKKAPPPHPPSSSITGVVLFSLLLLHYQGSYHWLVTGQYRVLEPPGKRPDPEPPPGIHSPTVLGSDQDMFLFASFHNFQFPTRFMLKFQSFLPSFFIILLIVST